MYRRVEKQVKRNVEISQSFNTKVGIYWGLVPNHPSLLDQFRYQFLYSLNEALKEKIDDDAANAMLFVDETTN